MWRRRLKRKGKCSERNRYLDHEDQYIILMKWLKRNGFNCKNCCLKPAEFCDTGRGLMTKKTLKPGDILTEIPRHLLVMAQDVLNTELGYVIKRQQLKPTREQVVCAFLISERSKGIASFWHPYINVLPKEFSTPAFCFSDQCDYAFLPRQTKIKALDQLAKIQASFQNAASLFADIERTFPHFHGIFNFEAFLWAWFVINTRSVYMECRDCEFLDQTSPNEFALAPFLDLLNHSPNAEVHAGFNVEVNCYQIRTMDSNTAYDQVFIHYGPHDNSSLLLEYGFVIPANPHDVIDFELDEVISAAKWAHNCQSGPSNGHGQEPMWERKAAMLRSEETLRGGLCCSREGPSWGLLLSLRVLFMSYAELLSWKRIVAVDSGVGAAATSSESLVAQAICKLLEDAYVLVNERLKRLDDSTLQMRPYLCSVQLLWKERLHILESTKACVDGWEVVSTPGVVT